jgi:F420H(2)-dependent quinone reductase
MSETKVSPNRKWIGDHVERYLQDPEAAHIWDASVVGVDLKVPTLLLTVTGRKSGKQIRTPLIYIRDGGRFAVVGSRGGSPEHPSWYLNLQANPDCEIQVAGEHHLVRARTAGGAERLELWQILLGTWPLYTKYQADAGSRELPVVVLESRG